VKTLYGELLVKVDPGTQHDSKKKLANYGIPKLPPNSSQKGHHFLTVKVNIPSTLSPAQKKIIEEYAAIEEPIVDENSKP